MQQRITLIARSASKPDVDWNYQMRTQRVAFVETVVALRFALGTALEDIGMDVERIIVDRAGSAEDFLDLMAGTPAEFCGDILFIRDDGSGFLSATGRGGDRVLYALTPHDIRFYLEMHDLVTGRAAFAMSA